MGQAATQSGSPEGLPDRVSLLFWLSQPQYNALLPGYAIPKGRSSECAITPPLRCLSTHFSAQYAALYSMLQGPCPVALPVHMINPVCTSPLHYLDTARPAFRQALRLIRSSAPDRQPASSASAALRFRHPDSLAIPNSLCAAP